MQAGYAYEMVPVVPDTNMQSGLLLLGECGGQAYYCYNNMEGCCLERSGSEYIVTDSKSTHPRSILGRDTSFTTTPLSCDKFTNIDGAFYRSNNGVNSRSDSGGERSVYPYATILQTHPLTLLLSISAKLRVRTVTKKSYVCTYQQCNKEFSRIYDLHRHRRGIHERQAQFSCRYAGCPREVRAFPRKDKRDEHEKKIHGTIHGNLS